MKTIRARVTPRGVVELEFGRDQELIDFVKTVSGFGWNTDKRRWCGGLHSLHALEFAAWMLEQQHAAHAAENPPWPPPPLRLQIAVSWPLMAPPLIMSGNLTLRDYQIWGAQQFLLRPDFILVWAPRVGKTSALIAAGATGISTGEFQRVIVCTPAQVVPEWEAALDKQFPGMLKRELVRGLGAADVASAHWVLVQHDQVTLVKDELLKLGTMGKFMFAFDEPQRFTEWKTPRSQTVMKLTKQPTCVRRSGLTGTPMRNDAEDLAVTFEVFGGLGVSKVGSRPWGYLKRYCNAHQGDHGWVCGETDPAVIPELKHRLASISHRLTREDVRPDLPPMHRTVMLCDLTREEGQRYKALEAALGKKAMQGAPKEQQAALKTLTRAAVSAKMNKALERITYHCGQRGVKILVAAHWHETLRDLSEQLESAKWPFYLAAGWSTPTARKKQIEAWRADPRPTPLLVNVVASGIGIDLSDADGSIVLEVPWVPSDLLQFEPRILDIHLGKRTTQPWIEYLLSKGTTDEDMALANLKKIAFIDQVVGAERESTGLARDLRASGVVNTVDLGLVDKGEGAVQAALDGLLARLSGEEASMSELAAMSGSAELVGAVAEAFEDEEKEGTDDDAYDDAVGG